MIESSQENDSVPFSNLEGKAIEQKNNFAFQLTNTHPSLCSEIKADAVANGGTFSVQRTAKLLFLHSGFQLLVIFRIQKRLRSYSGALSILGDILLKFATDLTGCYLSSKATLEGGIHLPHATGIVIGEGAIVRTGVTIYQNVTLGRRTAEDADYPELCQGCTVYAGAQILGKIVIGKNATVGANAVVLKSVPDQAVAVGIPARIIQK